MILPVKMCLKLSEEALKLFGFNRPEPCANQVNFGSDRSYRASIVIIL